MTRAWLLMLAMALPGTAGGALAQAALQPHIAAYRVGLDSRPGVASALIEARGGLVIEWRRECDGWVSRQRLGFVATTDAGDTVNHDVRFSSWEAMDGSRLRYVVRSFQNDRLQDEFRGIAELQQDDGGVADFTAPRKETVELPPGTVFPTEHIRQVLEAAVAGSRFVSHQVFDGFGFDSLTQVTSVIGAARPLEPGAGVASQAGSGSSAWPVNMAYYNVERDEQAPEFEATFLLDDKGILHDVGLDYGDFRLDAKLEQLELLAPPDC
jgi:EipB-like